MINFWDYEGKKYIDNSCGETLYLHGLAERAFKIGNMEYVLNSDGEKFINNISIEPTSKEKEIYSRLIDYKRMSSLDDVMNHKKYYDGVMNRIRVNDDITKVARLHDKNFKEFFEEYDVLIKYAIAKYGENCRIRLCGRETSNVIKFDGIIEVNGKEEKIEITTPFRSEKDNEQMKQLNKFGTTDFKMNYYQDPGEKIKNIVQEALKNKNSKNSYDSTVNLVVLYEGFEDLFSNKISNDTYFEALFEDFKEDEYIFKSVSVLIDSYKGSDLEIAPRIIKIK